MFLVFPLSLTLVFSGVPIRVSKRYKSHGWHLMFCEALLTYKCSNHRLREVEAGSLCRRAAHFRGAWPPRLDSDAIRSDEARSVRSPSQLVHGLFWRFIKWAWDLDWSFSNGALVHFSPVLLESKEAPVQIRMYVILVILHLDKDFGCDVKPSSRCSSDSSAISSSKSLKKPKTLVLAPLLLFRCFPDVRPKKTMPITTSQLP